MEWLTCSSKDRIERIESQRLPKGGERRGREAHFLTAEKFCKQSEFIFLGGREVERRMSIYKDTHTHTPHPTPPPEACSVKLKQHLRKSYKGSSGYGAGGSRRGEDTLPSEEPV